ncbi:MAG: polymer-forming cytoskeletal protein [Labilithrix sp.]|nr:polymer-forming cytoskeletal protein [Labilithrix sp.]
MSNVKSSATEKQTLVEDGTRFKGSLSSTCPVHVRGSVEGDVDSPAVTVSATGSVTGKIAAGTLKSDGKIAGECDVDSVQLTGAVENNTVIRAGSLDLKLSHPTGKLQLTFGRSRSGS